MGIFELLNLGVFLENWRKVGFYIGKMLIFMLQISEFSKMSKIGPKSQKSRKRSLLDQKGEFLGPIFLNGLFLDFRKFLDPKKAENGDFRLKSFKKCRF